MGSVFREKLPSLEEIMAIKEPGVKVSRVNRRECKRHRFPGMELLEQMRARLGETDQPYVLDLAPPNIIITGHYHAFENDHGRGINRESLTELVVEMINHVRMDLVQNATHEWTWMEFVMWLTDLYQQNRLPRHEYDQQIYWVRTSVPYQLRDKNGRWFSLMSKLDSGSIGYVFGYRPLSSLSLDHAGNMTRVHRDNLSDLVARAAEHHEADEDQTTDADMSMFLSLVFCEWHPGKRNDPTPEPPPKPLVWRYQPTRFYDLSVHIGHLNRDLAPLAVGQESSVQTDNRMRGAKVWLKAYPSTDLLRTDAVGNPTSLLMPPVFVPRSNPFPSGGTSTTVAPLTNAVCFQYHDSDGFPLPFPPTARPGQLPLYYIPTWNAGKAFLEAMRKWDTYQWTNVSGYNLAVAVYLARRRIQLWQRGHPVEARPEGDGRDMRALFERLIVLQHRGKVQVGDAAKAFEQHCFDVPPPLMASWCPPATQFYFAW